MDPRALSLVGLTGLLVSVLGYLWRRRTAARVARLEQRAELVEQQNRSMRLVLDHLEDGLVVVDLRGRIASEWSPVLRGWFGPVPASSALADCLRPHDPDCAAWFELALDALEEATMPAEITLGQLPSRMTVGTRALSLAYHPLREGKDIARLLVTVTDTSGQLERQRAETVQRDQSVLFELLSKDRNGVIDFLEEGSVIVDEIASTEATSPMVAARLIHTLKGNAEQFGMSAVADACHDVEARLEKTVVASPADRRLIEASWRSAAEQIRALIGVGAGRRLTVDVASYRSVLDLAQSRGQVEILAAMAAWDRDPVQARLESLGAFAERLAQRLGKPDLKPLCEGSSRGLDHAAWGSFWSSCVHVIRNAVDHGIEDPDERAARGKPAGGRLSLRADIVGDCFVVTIADDGAGINWSKLENKAMDEGLPFGTGEERLEVLFCDGLSTKTWASEISGRGVGLSAFRAEVVRRRGTIEVTTRRGEGTTFTARFPIEPPARAIAA